jgi:xanthine dehydrogenase accessory factor
MASDVLALAVELRSRGEPFALATVVRCERPTSAKPGAKALIRADGAITGWVGGACAEPVVVREAMRALRDGQPRLLGLVGQAGHARAAADGILEFAMTCHSGGTLEIYVEPYLPRPLLLLVGSGPVIDTLAAIAGATDCAAAVVAPDALGVALRRTPLEPATAVVVATHGAFDEDVLAQVLLSETRYVSLVASRKRAAAVMESLRRRGLAAERLARLRAPAGLDLGAVTPQEIAVSILAEVIQTRRRAGPAAPLAAEPDPSGAPREERDPVCGMAVDVATARYRSDVDGQAHYFCCARCLEAFEADPRQYRRS